MMTARRIRLLNWRSALVYTHRWLGIAGCVLFIVWFFSGIVMMYARMPALAPEEALARAPLLDLSSVAVSPGEAAEAAGLEARSLSVRMHQGRPAYELGAGGGRSRGLGAVIVFADTGELFAGVDAAGALEAARRFEPDYTGPWRLNGYLTAPDQWTLQAGGALPMYRFALDDAAGTRLYVSEASGEVVLRTTRRERVWGYLGPVLHWVYFTPLRRHGSIWTEVVIWSSVIGCLMCATGLVWGLLRFSPSARFRIRRVHAHSPYVGMLKWHHYTGLAFGVVTLTWIYSGLLSMGPFGWFEPSGGRARGRGAGAVDVTAISIEDVRRAHAAFASTFEPKALALTQVQGSSYWVAERPPAADQVDSWRSPSLMPRASRPRLERRYVSVQTPERGPFAQFPPESMVEVARQTLPDAPVKDAVWLHGYDSYYYSASGDRALPVLRVRFADPQETWLYLDPAQGGVVLRNEEITRLRRWLYQGLHSLDFPFLYYRRPLWDVVVIALSLGGLVLSVTTVTPAGRRLLRHVRGWLPGPRKQRSARDAPQPEAFAES